MNKEQLIATLQACYFGDKGAYNKILKEYKKLQQENQQLKDRINTYENPDDLTLMFMYCEEKAKDKIKELKEENKKYKYVIEEIEKICASVPEDWTICGVEKIYEIEDLLIKHDEILKGE